jgi:hypothetical protein
VEENGVGYGERRAGAKKRKKERGTMKMREWQERRRKKAKASRISTLPWKIRRK